MYEQLKRIPKNIYPLGNGTLFGWYCKSTKRTLDSNIIKEMPNIIAVQSEFYDPFAKAVIKNERLPAKVTPKPTMAEELEYQ